MFVYLTLKLSTTSMKYWFGAVLKQDRGCLCWCVSVRGKVSIHAFADFDEEVTIVRHVVELVMFNDVVREEFEGDLQVENIYIYFEELCAVSGDDAIE